MPETKIDVIVPVYRPDSRLRSLLKMLERQTLPPDRILLVNTERELFDGRCTEGIGRVEVVHIKKEEFDHGGTRHMAASMLDGDFLLFMTQDAVPADERLVEELYRSFADEQVCAAYARQLPAAGCRVLERYTRSFNYGPQSRTRTAEDLPELGIKTFFCSNVCAMYRREIFDRLGGFVRRTIFNEDMIYAARAVRAGFKIAYAADARVLHSHNYTALQQFQRNFDLGVSHAQYPEIFDDVPPEGEGMKLVKKTAAFLAKHHPLLLPRLFCHSAAKLIGYRLGKAYQKLPPGLVRRCSMQKSYWEKTF